MVMLSQRAWDAENRAKNRSSNGPPRAQSKAVEPSILRRKDARKPSGVCWYPYKECGESPQNQGGTADRIIRP